MIKWILISLFTLNLYAQVLDSEDIINSKKYNRVNINLCKESSLGCVPSVSVDTEKFNLDITSLDPHKLDGFQKMKEAGVSLGMTVDSYGFISKEKGHMPNPMVEQNIFKYVYKTDAKLRICHLEQTTQALGCADSISMKVDRKDIEATADYSKVSISKDDYLNKLAFVVGYYTLEKGHMPNPMVEQHVFKVVKVTFSSANENEISDDSMRDVVIKNLFGTPSSASEQPVQPVRVDQE